MNKKIIVAALLIALLPAVFAGVWLLSVVGNKMTLSNVSSVVITTASGESFLYTSENDREFFFQLHENMVPIEEQEFDEEVYSLYVLEYVKIQGNVFYYLCLSADTKNCLAYDENNDWYRIDSNDAQKLLINYDVSGVYKYSDVPQMNFFSSSEDYLLKATEYDWNYLVADGSYVNSNEKIDTNLEEIINVSSHEGIDFDFTVKPDWYNVKIYDDDIIIYDGRLDNPSDFTCVNDSYLKIVATVQWYDSTTNLYNGEAVYEFDVFYDVNASYSINKNEFNTGEVAFILLSNANDSEYIVTSEFLSSAVNMLEFKSKLLALVPIPMNLTTGDYEIKINSDSNGFSIPIKVNERDFGETKVGLIKSESPYEYGNALKNFVNEISSSKSIVTEDVSWIDGCLTPIQKFVDSKEKYWVSAPSYGTLQIVDGVKLDERNYGVHYVKSMESDSLEVRAISDGIVCFLGKTTAFGNTVIIEHGYGLKSVYGHLESLTVDVGTRVIEGDTFATAKPENYSVSTTELFFAICVNGEFVNPFNFINEPKTYSNSEKSLPIDFLK